MAYYGTTMCHPKSALSISGYLTQGEVTRGRDDCGSAASRACAPGRGHHLLTSVRMPGVSLVGFQTRATVDRRGGDTLGDEIIPDRFAR
jgi:hypothetical protein